MPAPREADLPELAAARAGRVTDRLRRAAARERLDPEALRVELAAGRAVLLANPAHRNVEPLLVGRATPVKLNANLGLSPGRADEPQELEKLRLALALGSDTVMDLSTGGDLGRVRRRFLELSTAPVGTVPIYQALAEAGSLERFEPERLWAAIEEQAADGVDFMTVHCGLKRAHLPLLARRLAGIVSRGGSILAHWMDRTGRENPLYAEYDRLLELARRHSVTLSLGDGLRPGALADAGDAAQFAELETLGELARRARAAGVQAMIEGPGHVPLDRIPEQVRREIEQCDDAPFYVLGPVVADCAPGYDHITSAIGAAVAGWHGASLLCYVTPREHLGLPDLEDVRQGVVAYKIAAHAANVARGFPGARERDDAISRARVAFDWESVFRLALDPERARALHAEAAAEAAGRPAAGCPAGAAEAAEAARHAEYCSMCGPDFCAMAISRKLARAAGGEARDVGRGK